MSSHILTKREKIGYGLGDAASHIIFDNVMFYMMFFLYGYFWHSRWLRRHYVPASACARCDFRSYHGVSR